MQYVIKHVIRDPKTGRLRKVKKRTQAWTTTKASRKRSKSSTKYKKPTKKKTTQQTKRDKVRIPPDTNSKKTTKMQKIKALKSNTQGFYNSSWRPQPDLNRCCRRERPVSWTWLDDGDARLTPYCKMVTVEVSTSNKAQLLCQLAQLQQNLSFQPKSSPLSKDSLCQG